jgi:hypothetical protein
LKLSSKKKTKKIATLLQCELQSSHDVNYNTTIIVALSRHTLQHHHRYNIAMSRAVTPPLLQRYRVARYSMMPSLQCCCIARCNTAIVTTLPCCALQHRHRYSVAMLRTATPPSLQRCHVARCNTAIAIMLPRRALQHYHNSVVVQPSLQHRVASYNVAIVVTLGCPLDI